MRRDFDIVILGQTRWDSAYSSTALCLAKEFAKNNRVFYIEHPFSLKDFIIEYNNGNIIKSRKSALLFARDNHKIIGAFSDNVTMIVPKLTLPINWLSSGALYDFLSRYNDHVMNSALRNTIKVHGIQQYILLNSFDPFFFRVITQDVKPILKIYQTVDDISQESYIAKHGVGLEKEAVKNADVTLATSKQLTKIVAKYTPNAFCLPNAADYSAFNIAAEEKLTRPKELLGVNKRIIIYTGNIGSRINYQLLINLAIFHQDKILLMVGPITSSDCKDSGLDQLPNVVFTGQKHIKELPSYLQHSDCAIIPFEYSLLTRSIYPLKINEYLSAGKPVVSTAFSEDIIDFNAVAYILASEEEFIQSIDIALTEDNPQRRSQRILKARDNTWAGRVEEFWRIVAQFIK